MQLILLIFLGILAYKVGKAAIKLFTGILLISILGKFLFEVANINFEQLITLFKGVI